VRICSLLPSATEILADLGLTDSLVGVSEECRWPPEVVGKPVVTAARIDPSTLTSIEIDAAVRASLVEGGSLYAVDADLIAELDPDLIVTQDLCSVCAVSSTELTDACPVGAEIVSLDPRTLGEVAASVRLLAERLEVVTEGERIASQMMRSIEQTAELVRGRVPRRVFFAEWLDPPFCAGHWVPEMIELAGGRDVVGVAATPSRSVTWDEVVELDPEMVVLGPCGFGAEEAAERAAGLEFPFPAVAVDGDSYFSRPALRLADGVRQLAHLFHPEAVPDPGLPAIWLEATAAKSVRRRKSDGPTSQKGRPVLGPQP
jgi:iron complex transport system substrate-binding protein